MTPERVESWLRAFRNFGTTVAALFCFFWGPTRVHDPALLGIVLGAGCALVGTPLFLPGQSREKDDREEPRE